MKAKEMDWKNLGFTYQKTDKRFSAIWREGQWSEGRLIEEDKLQLSESAGVLQYAQTCFEGLKAYRT